MSDSRPLEEVMDEMSREVEERGLTPEKLSEILSEPEALPALTAEDRERLSIAAVSPSNETDNLLSLIERLTGEAIVPADGSER